MGNATQGVQPLGGYAGSTTAGDALDKMLALIPNPDTTSSSGAIAGGGFLDEMSPAAAVQLRVEIEAAKAVVGTFNAPA